ncbi:hypothetical protein B9G53_01965 [Pseudanabaena sp. SR411]|nr:hypothetical protein B9G53_01965 [Pseudanabaena sp. SR411]
MFSNLFPLNTFGNGARSELGFNDEQLAHKTFELLTSEQAISFYSSQIFGDDKRPIKSSILNSLNLTALLEKE